MERARTKSRNLNDRLPSGEKKRPGFLDFKHFWEKIAERFEEV